MSSESAKITHELNKLQHRGETRGADAVFDAAWGEATDTRAVGPADGGRQSFWLVAAGLLVLLIGGGALFALSGEEGDDETVIAPAACAVLVDPSTGLADGAQGALADDPVSMLCPVDGASDGRSLRDLDVMTYGGVEARVIEITEGEREPWWVAEIIPFPAETGPLPVDPEPRSGGAVFALAEQARFNDGILRVETELVGGHAERSGNEAAGEGHWVIVTAASDSRQILERASSPPEVFAGEYSLSCSITEGGVAGCRLVNPDGDTDWKTTFFTEDLSTPPEGGVDADGTVFAQCDVTDESVACFNQVTFEFAETSMTIFVDGQQFFRQTDLPPLPEELLDAELNVWWGVSTVHSEINQIRFHGRSN